MASVDRSLVEGLPLFAGLAPEQIDQLLQEAQSVRYPKGTNVFQQDEEAHSFFILLHGHLRVFKLTPDGQQVVVRFVAPGEVFGVAMAIGRKTYPATATAVVDSIALVWPSAAWPRLVATHPGLAVNTLQTVGSRLQEPTRASSRCRPSRSSAASPTPCFGSRNRPAARSRRVLRSTSQSPARTSPR